MWLSIRLWSWLGCSLGVGWFELTAFHWHAQANLVSIVIAGKTALCGDLAPKRPLGICAMVDILMISIAASTSPRSS